MKENTDRIKEIAGHYFDGTISPKDEFTLFRYLSGSKDNQKKFREWESEWEYSHIPNGNDIQHLNLLRREIFKARNRKKRLLRATISVAAAIGIIVTIFSIRHEPAKENIDNKDFIVEVPSGGKSRLLLPDGSLVWLNSASSLTYSAGFNSDSRTVILSGEAYFEVAQNESLPFEVLSQGCRFTVLGTKFNISAYNNDSDVIAVLMEGSLSFESEEDNVLMKPGNLVCYNKSDGTTAVDMTNAELYKSWINGKIKYDDITLPSLLNRLSRQYDTEIILLTSDFNKKSFRVSFTEDQSIETVLDALKKILPISVSQKDKKYYIDKVQD